MFGRGSREEAIVSLSEHGERMDRRLDDEILRFYTILHYSIV